MLIKFLLSCFLACSLAHSLTWLKLSAIASPRAGRGVVPYVGYMGMCGPKGCGFSAVLVINRVSILADFGHFGHE